MSELIPIAIKLRASGGVSIEWSDGHQGTYPYSYLRSNCPCAGCENRPPRQRELEPGQLPILGQRLPHPIGANPVGHYAIQFRWNDGHEAGIYSFDFLRRLCPCPQCRPSASAD